MDQLIRLIDRTVQDLCQWLNATLSGRHGLANVGYELAGLGGFFVLPTDRRTNPNEVMMAATEYPLTHKDGSGKPVVISTGVYTPNTKCNFWAYCHMNGQPCVWCQGHNDLERSANARLDLLCPAKKTPGVCWYGCCVDGTGSSRLIAFWDCCGTGFCESMVFPGVARYCNNWPGAKSWCNITGKTDSTGPSSYYCTVVTDAGDCS